MDNREFLQSLGITDEETCLACLDAMQQYGANKWWEPDVDPRKYAYYQLHEERLLGTTSRFGEALKLLLGRDVSPFEVVAMEDTVKQAAKRAWENISES